MYNKKVIYIFLVAVLCVFLTNPVLALKSDSIGTSSVTLSSTVVNMMKGRNVSIGFTITLVSGTTWGTNLQISNPYQNYFSFSVSPSTADPTYSGTIEIATYNVTPLGKYDFNVSAAGDDPSVNSVLLTVNVVSNTNASYPTNKSVATQSSNPNITVYFWYVAGLLIATAIALVLTIKYYKKKFASASIKLFSGSMVIFSISSAYLLLFDKLLVEVAIIHWYVLLIFLAGSIIATLIIYFTKDPYRKLSRRILGALFFVFAIGLIFDAIFNLPFSSVGENVKYFGIDYLFGSNGTAITISVDYSILLLCSVVNGFVLEEGI